MKKLTLMSIAIVLFTLSTINAQESAQKKRASKLEMKNFDNNVKMEINQLDYRDKNNKLKGLATLDTSKASNPWCQLHLKLGPITGGIADEKFVDNLMVKWEIYVPADKAKKLKALKITKEVNYLEAPKDVKDIPIALYIRPAILIRYFDGKKTGLENICAKISIFVNGNEITNEREPIIVSPKPGNRLDKRAWAKVWDDEKNVAELSNSERFFLTRMDTPFALQSFDDFLFIDTNPQTK